MQQQGGSEHSTRFVEIVHSLPPYNDFRLFIRFDEVKTGKSCGKPPWKVQVNLACAATVLLMCISLCSCE